jgi:hypothetical protein
MHVISYRGRALTYSLQSDGSSSQCFSRYGNTTLIPNIPLNVIDGSGPFDKHTTALALIFLRWKLIKIDVEFVPLGGGFSFALGMTADAGLPFTATPPLIMTMSSSRLVASVTTGIRQHFSFTPPHADWLYTSEVTATTTASARQGFAGQLHGRWTSTPTVGRYGDFVFHYTIAFADPNYGNTVDLDEKHGLGSGRCVSTKTNELDEKSYHPICESGNLVHDDYCKVAAPSPSGPREVHQLAPVDPRLLSQLSLTRASRPGRA